MVNLLIVVPLVMTMGKNSLVVNQGEIAIVYLTQKRCEQPLKVFGRTHTCDVDGRIIIGASTQDKPGLHVIKNTNVGIRVRKSIFPKIYLKNLPKPQFATRSRTEEKEIIKKALTLGPKICTAQFPADRDFTVPVQGTITDTFGTHRFFKEDKISQHHGIDLQALEGTPVITASYGAVVLNDELSYEGKFIILYHGSGIYTMYMHLSESFVSLEQIVNSGDTIGLSGSTGFSTGNHLHFSVKVNGAYVDPLKFVKRFNELLRKDATEPSSPSILCRGLSCFTLKPPKGGFNVKQIS